MMNKASKGDGIPVELFKILKDDAFEVLHSICEHIWKTQQWPQDWKRSFFISIPNKDNGKECSDYCTIALISHASKVMLKILQARLQQYVNRELPDVQAGFRKAEEPEITLPTSSGSLKKQESSRKSSISALPSRKSSISAKFIVGHNKLEILREILREMGIADHLICLLRNLYAGQEATVRTGHGTIDWFQIGKGKHQGCILSPCLFNLYADDTTLMAESEEELKSLLMKVKEESEKIGLKLNIQKN